MSDPISPLASDLCTACGLCCAGPLFIEILLDPAERDLAERLGLPVMDDEDGPVLAFPCTRLDGACCTVYADRPTGCRTFRCTLLRRLDANEVPLFHALELVESALVAARALEAELAGETVPSYRRRRARALIDRNEALPRAPARDRLNELDGILDQHFRKPHQNQTIPFDAVEGRSGWL